jgi:pyroglutamyl-peptidase
LTYERPLLVAAFEPFAGRPRNRSWEVVRCLPPADGVEKVQLPVDFDRLPSILSGLAARAPRALLLVGESPDRRVRVEGVALNLLDSDLPDNAGANARGRTIEVGAPFAIPARWDPHEVVGAIRAAGVKASPSFHAGTYACNAALYLSLRILPPEVPVGLLHLPRWRWPKGIRLSRLSPAVHIALQALLPTEGLAAPGDDPPPR